MRVSPISLLLKGLKGQPQNARNRKELSEHDAIPKNAAQKFNQLLRCTGLLE
jgi:hypothetical protein